MPSTQSPVLADPEPPTNPEATDSRQGVRTGLRWIPIHITTYPVLAGLVIAVGILVRLIQWLAGRDLWFNEILIARNLDERSYLELLGALDYHQTAPALWLLLERLAHDLLGSGERALRLVPLLFGIGTLFLVAWLARRLLTMSASLIVLAFVAVNDRLIYFSNEVKQYSAEAFAVTLVIAVGILLCQRVINQRLIIIFWVAASIASVLSIMAIPVTAAVATLVAIRARPGWRRIRRFAMGVPVWLALVVPLYLTGLRASQTDQSLQEMWAFVYPERPLYDIPATIGWLIDTGSDLATDPLGVSYAVLYFILAVVGAIKCGRRHGLSVVGILLCPWVIGLVASALHIYPLWGRLALYGVPACLLLIGYAVDFPAPRGPDAPGRHARINQKPRFLVWAFSLGLALPTLIPQVFNAVGLAIAPPDPYQYREAIAYIAQHRQDGEPLLVIPERTSHVLHWYGAPAGVTADVQVQPARTEDGCDPSALAALLRGTEAAWVLRISPYERTPEEFLIDQLRQFGTETVVSFHDAWVFRFDLTGAPPETAPSDDSYPWNCVTW